MMKVKIPAGVNSGSTLRVRGEGDAGPRGYVAFNFSSDPDKTFHISCHCLVVFSSSSFHLWANP